MARLMDRFHDRFAVYDDVSSAGNHFQTYAKMPSPAAGASMNGSWSVLPHSGATCIRAVFTDVDAAGVYFMNGVLPDGETTPRPNFGGVPDAGIDMSGAESLTFWARGERGGEEIEFFVAGVGRDATSGVATARYPDSSPRQPPAGQTITLTTDWRPYRITLVGLDLSYVLGGFGWWADSAHNPTGAVFYVDDIQFNLSPAARDARLAQPRFLVSYDLRDVQPDPFDGNEADDIDLVLRNTAFVYDNALALLAFLAIETDDGLRRAKLVGDAFLYAAQHDRSFTDHRLRTAYAAGDIALPPGWKANGKPGTAPIPGFYHEPSARFFEVAQEAIDTGNNAWAMIALLALHRRTGDARYLDAARDIGNFVLGFQNDTGTYKGFLGGISNPETGPTPRPYASTEHNLDLHAAFLALGELSGEPRWGAAAQHAREFAESMWDEDRHVFLAGTIDPSTRNTVPGQLPVDVQAWSGLSIPALRMLHPEAPAIAETYHRVSDMDGITGFDFNDDKDGIWFEGTGHMAVAYAFSGDASRAEELRAVLRRVQASDLGDGQGVPAASHDGVSTGFDFSLYRRLHVGATAWNVFAQLRFDPYGQSCAAPAP